MTAETTIVAAIMCGGKATRMMNPNVEKPLLEVNGVTLVERMILALGNCTRITSIFAAVSPNTRRTAEFLKEKKKEKSFKKTITIMETPGQGYSQDLCFLLSKLKPSKVLVTPVDLPLLSTEIIDDIIDIAAGNKSKMHAADAAAVSIVMEKGFIESTGFKPSVLLKLGSSSNNRYDDISYCDYCHSGITFFDTAKIADSGIDRSSLIEEKYVVMNRIELAANVNTKEELELAQRLTTGPARQESFQG